MLSICTVVRARFIIGSGILLPKGIIKGNLTDNVRIRSEHGEECVAHFVKSEMIVHTFPGKHDECTGPHYQQKEQIVTGPYDDLVSSIIRGPMFELSVMQSLSNSTRIFQDSVSDQEEMVRVLKMEGIDPNQMYYDLVKREHCKGYDENPFAHWLNHVRFSRSINDMIGLYAIRVQQFNF